MIMNNFLMKLEVFICITTVSFSFNLLEYPRARDYSILPPYQFYKNENNADGTSMYLPEANFFPPTRRRQQSPSIIPEIKKIPENKDLDGRFFGIFSNLNLSSVGIFTKKIKRGEFNALVNRVTALEAAAAAAVPPRGGGDAGDVLATRAGDVLATSAGDAQSIKISEPMRKIIAGIRPRCPSTAPNSRIVVDRCFSVEVEPVEFEVAAQVCQSKGGILAEPAVANRKQFYTTIRNSFPAEIKKIEARRGTTRNIFIGLRRRSASSTRFEFLACGVTIDAFDNKIFTAVPKVNFQAAQKVVIVPPGNMWQRVGSLVGGEKHSYICQYDTLL